MPVVNYAQQIKNKLKKINDAQHKLRIRIKNSCIVNYFYLNPTEACQTNASKRKNTGIAGIMSTIGRNTP